MKHGLCFLASLGLFIVMVEHSYADEKHTRDSLYEVQPGDTLWQLADEYHGNVERWRELQRLNRIGEPRLMRPGRILDLGNVPDITATVVHVEGDAWQREEGGQVLTSLVPGQEIMTGQWIETGANAFVTLTMAKRKRVVLPSQSRVRFTARLTEGMIQFHLESGEVESYIPPSDHRRQEFEVLTPTGIIGVRGTHFRVSHDSGESRATVLDGTVAFMYPTTSGEEHSYSTVLQAGQGALLDVTGELRLVGLLDAPQLLESRRGRDGELELSLSPMPEAHAYRVNIDRDPRFETIIRGGTFLTPDIRFDNMPEGFYYARVSAVDAMGIEGWSGQHLLFHRPFFTYVEPYDGGYEFRWTNIPGVEYRLQFSNESAFVDPFFDLALESSGVKLSSLPYGSFYWRLLIRPLREGDDEVYVVDSGELIVSRQ